jgi:hypothetical protein
MTATAAPPNGAPVPRVVPILALSIFALGTSEFMIAGLLPELAADLRVGIPKAGYLISAFAVGMIIGAPAMAVLTLRLPRRTTLLAALAVFIAGHMLRGDEGAAALAPLRRLAGRHGPASEAHPPTDPGRPRTVAIARSDDQRMGARAARYGRDIPVTDVSGLGTARYGRPRTGPDRTGPTIMPRPRRPTRAFPPSTRCTARPHNRRARARRHRAA